MQPKGEHMLLSLPTTRVRVAVRLLSYCQGSTELPRDMHGPSGHAHVMEISQPN